MRGGSCLEHPVPRCFVFRPCRIGHAPTNPTAACRLLADAEAAARVADELFIWRLLHGGQPLCIEVERALNFPPLTSYTGDAKLMKELNEASHQHMVVRCQRQAAALAGSGELTPAQGTAAGWTQPAAASPWGLRSLEGDMDEAAGDMDGQVGGESDGAAPGSAGSTRGRSGPRPLRGDRRKTNTGIYGVSWYKHGSTQARVEVPNPYDSLRRKTIGFPSEGPALLSMAPSRTALGWGGEHEGVGCWKWCGAQFASSSRSPKHCCHACLPASGEGRAGSRMHAPGPWASASDKFWADPTLPPLHPPPNPRLQTRPVLPGRLMTCTSGASFRMAGSRRSCSGIRILPSTPPSPPIQLMMA